MKIKCFYSIFPFFFTLIMSRYRSDSWTVAAESPPVNTHFFSPSYKYTIIVPTVKPRKHRLRQKCLTNQSYFDYFETTICTILCITYAQGGHQKRGLYLCKITQNARFYINNNNIAQHTHANKYHSMTTITYKIRPKYKRHSKRRRLFHNSYFLWIFRKALVDIVYDLAAPTNRYSVVCRAAHYSYDTAHHQLCSKFSYHRQIGTQFFANKIRTTTKATTKSSTIVLQRSATTTALAHRKN